MKESAERPDSHARTDRLITGSIDVSRPDDNIREVELTAILDNQFVLFDFRESISVSAEFRSRFRRRGLIKQPFPSFTRVGIDRKGTNADKSAQATAGQGRFDKIASSHNRV